MKKIFPLKNLKFLPVGFQYLFLYDPESLKDIFTLKLIKVKSYQTSKYTPSKFYKPISKMLSK